MSYNASSATVVGVSFVELMEQNGWDTDRADSVAGALGLDVWMDIPKLDTPTDYFIGVVFRDRPTDAEVAEATTRVNDYMQALEHMIGKSSSGVEVWQGVCIS